MRSKKLNENIARNLITFRESLGLSQRQFALNAGIDQAHMNKIERCRMSVSLTNLQKISETYNIPIKVFFDFTIEGEQDHLRREISLLVDSINDEWKQRLLISILKELKDANPS